MSYALENALFQWEEGERRLRGADEPRRGALERAAALVLEELRRRLGSRFSLAELSDLYAAGGDWASDVARSAFGEEVVEHYLNRARIELEAFEAAVTDWERVRGFERL